MKRIYLITLIILGISSTVQAQNYDWAKTFGGTGGDIGYSMSVDANGNVYTTGSFRGTVDFNPGAGLDNHTSNGNGDIFVQKLDASGSFLWAKTFGGILADGGSSICVDANGNVYTMGHFAGTVDFDPGAGVDNHTSNGSSDIFVQKLDSSGNFLWAKTFGGILADGGRSICVDANGNVHSTGNFQGTVDFNPGAGVDNHSSNGSSDIFVQKLDASGNFLWAKTFGGTGFDIGESISVDANGNVHSTGNFEGTVDFNPGAGVDNHSSNGFYDIFVQKLDASGSFLWAKTFGGTGDDIGNYIVDANGNVHFMGHFVGTVDFDPGAGVDNHTSNGSSDIFVQKLDSSGNFLWAKTFGGTAIDYGISMSVDANGNVYTTGNFEGTVDFNPGAGVDNHSSNGSSDIFVQKLDTSGNFLWVKTFGGTGGDIGFSISVDANENVYTTGIFTGIVDFDPGTGIDIHNSNGGLDIFVQKISQCLQTTGTDVITACNSYAWIDGNTYIASNNTATYTLTNSVGCDSVVTLDLTINSISDITTTTSGVSISANNLSATYQWLDCDNGNAIIAGQTTQVFTATNNGSYAVELTENGCVDTSLCVSITTVGILENSFPEEVIIYPNPTDGDFSINLGNNYNSIKITITDLHSSIIQTKNYNNAQFINLTLEEPSGIYLLTLESAKQRAVIQLVKK